MRAFPHVMPKRSKIPLITVPVIRPRASLACLCSLSAAKAKSTLELRLASKPKPAYGIWYDYPALPLQPFLVALSAEGFRLTVRDYERIALVLRANGPWTILRLRDSLRALLARDEDQSERFDACFATCFDLDLTIDPALAEVDVRQALAFLENAARRGELPIGIDTPRHPPPPPPPLRRNRRNWGFPLPYCCPWSC